LRARRAKISSRFIGRAQLQTFITPAPTQERAAEIADVPFSTYRRHLRAGIDQVVQILWQSEIGK